MAKEIDKLKDHNYDGIQEYDNDLPRWWLYMFYASIIFAVGYVAYFHFGPGELPIAKLNKEMALLEQIRPKESIKKVAKQEEAEPLTEQAEAPPVLADLLNDAATLSRGSEVYVSRCAVCHGKEGQGLVGPNFADKYWIHGGSLEQIRHIVSEGVKGKGMLAWKRMMSASDMDAVTIYIRSLEGTNPPNPKAPQGELVER